MATFWAVCEECFLFNGSVFYLVYGLIVFITSLTDFHRTNRSEAAAIKVTKQPPLPGELGELFQPRASINTQVLVAALGFASFDFFRNLVNHMLEFIRFIFLMRDKPNFLTSFKRYLILYLIIIPLPAAFLAPVGHPQRQPDLQLMMAVILLIVINALGDVISVRLTLSNFENLKFEGTISTTDRTEKFWSETRNEVFYYLNVIQGAAYSLLVMIGVLALSSILFGVQIGEIDFSLSTKFFAGAWHRITEFPSLAFEPYWFRGQNGPFESKGVPGLFLYAIVTFIPIIILFALAVLWLLLMPLRIAINLPTGRVPRIISSELAVIVLCITLSFFFKINVLDAYSFLTQS